MKNIRTRFAPSPTGYMHIGNLRTALYAYFIAKSNDGQFILRIEDTDQQREVIGAKEVIYQTLKETGLLWDEGPDKSGDYGPYIQSLRLDIYHHYAKELIALGGARYCFCDATDIKDQTITYDHDTKDPCLQLTDIQIQDKINQGIPYVIRQTIHPGQSSFDDEVYGHIDVDHETLDEGVLIKSDGYPTYNFANVIDDHLMKITHVIRGNEYLSSTPKYNMIYDAFSWQRPTYIHLPPVMKDETHKLSKRNGDASFQDLLKQGYLPEAIINYIALLGWSPCDDQEIMSLASLIQHFDIKRIHKSPSIFDIDKLKWMNGMYIRQMPLIQLHQQLIPIYQSNINISVNEEYLSKILQNRISTFQDVTEMIDFINQPYPFSKDLYLNKKMKTNVENSLYALQLALDKIKDLQDYNEESLHDLFIQLALSHQLKNGQVMYPIRVALSNKAMTPGGAVELAYLLGQEETIKRIKQAIFDLKQ